MTRYLEIKPGSIAEVAIRLRDDYQAFFKKELEKTGKSIPQMTDSEKKAFFDKVDKAYTAKNEEVKEKVKDEKTMLVVNPKDKKPGNDGVVRISKDKWPEYQKKGYIQAEAVNPYAVGMAAAMKATGDKPPLKKSTIVKAHDIAKKIEKNEEVKEEIKVDRPAIIKSLQDRLKKLQSDPDHGGKKDMIDYVQAKLKMLQSTKDEELTAGQKKLPPALQKAIEKKEKNEEVSLEEGQYKEIDIRKGDLRIAKDKRQALKDKYNAIMANQASGDEHAIADQIQKLDMSIKKQEQELIDIMKKSKESEKKEEVEISEAEGTSGGGMLALRAIKAKRQRLEQELQALNKDDPNYKEKAAAKKKEIENQKEIMARKQREVFDSYNPSLEKNVNEAIFDVRLDVDGSVSEREAQTVSKMLSGKGIQAKVEPSERDRTSVTINTSKSKEEVVKALGNIVDESKKVDEALNPGLAPDSERIANLQKQLLNISYKLMNLDKSNPESKTKEAILKADAATKKLRLADLMKRRSNETNKDVKKESKMNYKSMKKSLKKEEETPKKTLTDKPLTKVDVDPKLPTH